MKENAVKIIKALVSSYVVSFVLVLIMSFIMYKLKLSESQAYIGVIVIYVLSCAAGGFFLAKKTQSKRLPGGIFIGILYFVVLTLVSIIVNRGIYSDLPTMMKALAACVLGGAIGGIAG